MLGCDFIGNMEKEEFVHKPRDAVAGLEITNGHCHRYPLSWPQCPKFAGLSRLGLGLSIETTYNMRYHAWIQGARSTLGMKN